VSDWELLEEAFENRLEPLLMSVLLLAIFVVMSSEEDRIVLMNYTFLQDAFEKLLMSKENKNGFRLMYPPPLCIVTDFLLSWTVTSVAKLGISRVEDLCHSFLALQLTSASSRKH